MSKVLSVTALVALGTTAAHAQKPLEPVVVTAARTDAPLATSAAAVTRLSGDALRKLPVRTVADALQQVPGLVVLQGDGLGDAPRVVARGFYGGGETDYVTVLVDGVPTTQLTTGLVNWDQIPLAAIESIEVVRGGASALYGDAAIGGVVNLVTRHDTPFARWRLAGGEFGQAQGSGAVGGTLGTHAASAFVDVQRSDGYRAHERRNAESVGASLGLVKNATHTLTLSALEHRRDFDDPGPLADALLAASRRAASPFYRFDRTQQQLHRLALDGTATGSRVRVRGYVTGEYQHDDAIRTQPLSPQFADTKDRRGDAERLVASLQGETASLPIGVPNRLVVGADLSAGHLTSDYLKMVSGGASAYNAFGGAVGDVDTRGDGWRNSAAAFGSWEITPVDPLRISLGTRADWIADRYAPSAPSTGPSTHANRSAVSPRVGVNYRWLLDARQTGNVYVTAGRSFKAPTMDQLFDQRRTPVPFPPFTISTSNSQLEAQYGNSVEAGAYHSASLVPGSLDARLSVSAYQTDMRNELDFDLKQFRYVNIGRSRHRGVETGLTLGTPSGVSAFANLTLQRATATNGSDAGKLLKAIPRRVLGAGLARNTVNGLSAAVSVSDVGPAFLDDANTASLPGHTQLDARASYPVLRTRLFVDVRNLLGSTYSSTGFPDPAGSNVVYYYPAAGRVLRLGIESR